MPQSWGSNPDVPDSFHFTSVRRSKGGRGHGTDPVKSCTQTLRVCFLRSKTCTTLSGLCGGKKVLVVFLFITGLLINSGRK